jgi:uncharacterized protein
MADRRPTTIAVVVKPGAALTGIRVERGLIHVRVREKAHEGKANQACRAALAKALGVAPSTLTIVRGASARTKVFALATLTPAELAVRLARLPP